MFNHLNAGNLHTIARREIEKNVGGFEESMGVEVAVDDRVAAALIFSEGGKADARTVNGRANAFFYDELYELFRLLGTQKGSALPKKVSVSVSLDSAESDVKSLFVNAKDPEVLVFADSETAKECKEKLTNIVCHTTSSIEEAKDILFNHDITLVICDVRTETRESAARVLNAEDIDSVGHDFLNAFLGKYGIPVYLLLHEKKRNNDNQKP